MTDDYNEKNTGDNTQREINMIEKGKQRLRDLRNAKEVARPDESWYRHHFG